MKSATDFKSMAKSLHKIADGLGQLGSNATSVAAQVSGLLAARGKAVATLLTPRDKENNGNHLADFWTFKIVRGTNKAAATVFNEDPRANQPLRGSSGLTLLHVLEFGSDPHRIDAVNAPFLVFFWEKTGRVEHFKSVNHPGTPPFAILELSKLAVEEQIPVAEEFVVGLVRRALDGRSQSGSFKNFFASIEALGSVGL